MRSHNERAPGAGPVLSQNQSAAKPTEYADKDTPALARLSWNGHPALLSSFVRSRQQLEERELRNAARDPEAFALAIFDAVGPKRARALAYELLGLSQEVVAR